MNYTQLFTTVKNYCENEFPSTTFTGTDNSTVVITPPSDQINTFIQQAETRIYNSVQIPALRRNVTGNCTASTPYLNCPTDFLSSYSLAIIDSAGNYNYALNKDVNFIREAYPTPSSTGLPKYYALFGSVTGNVNNLTFMLGPTPNAAYSAELHYFYYPQTIVTAGTTWLGNNYDPVLLYGSLVEAATFMKAEQDLVALYNQKYTEAMGELKRLGDGLERQDAYRSGQVRVKVT
jgi:hypothetical protein